MKITFRVRVYRFEPSLAVRYVPMADNQVHENALMPPEGYVS